MLLSLDASGSCTWHTQHSATPSRSRSQTFLPSYSAIFPAHIRHTSFNSSLFPSDLHPHSIPSIPLHKMFASSRLPGVAARMGLKQQPLRLMSTAQGQGMCSSGHVLAQLPLLFFFFGRTIYLTRLQLASQAPSSRLLPASRLPAMACSSMAPVTRSPPTWSAARCNLGASSSSPRLPPSLPQPRCTALVLPLSASLVLVSALAPSSALSSMASPATPLFEVSIGPPHQLTTTHEGNAAS